jgi:lysozyme family protein
MSDFDKCVSIIIDDFEGGDKVVYDSGGATRFGISSRAHPGLDIPNLSREQAIEIYKRSYWDEIGADKHPWPMNLVLFDAAVNQGAPYAEALAMSAVDYVEALLMRVERYTDIAKKNPLLRKYHYAWVNRVVRIYEMLQKA